ncbi:MAG: NAD-dependent deacylase [Myxococcota bacterium]
MRVVFFTGAGMSAESGVPTYRGAGGIWREYEPERYACQAAFERDPAAVWAFHNYRRALVAACAPHDGHRVLVAAEAQLEHVTIVTQNIDGMHQLAGSERVFELHGSLWRVRCERCGARYEGRESPLEPTACPSCGAPWRPAIVWFGDMLDGDTIERAAAAIRACDCLVSIGTSAAVYPAAQLPQLAAGAELIEINPEPTPMSPLYGEHLRGPASVMLVRLAQRWGLTL